MSTIFVTVGSTRFDKLIKKLLSDDFLDVLRKSDYKKLIIQAGNSLIPHHDAKGLNIEIYKYKSEIMNDARKANIVISHAGAGTCLEMLRLNKLLVIVVNDTLMDNHQTELAEQLESDKYAIVAKVDNIDVKLKEIINEHVSIRKFPTPTNKFGEIIEAHLKHIST